MTKKYIGKIVFLTFLSGTLSYGNFLQDIQELEGEVQGLLGDIQKTFTIGVPGLGAISLSCDLPSYTLPLDSLGMCSLQDKLLSSIPLLDGGINLSDIGNFSFGKNGCGFSVNVSDSSCGKLDLNKWCSSADKKTASKDALKKLKSGIGGFDLLSDKKIALYGGKEIFGKEVCGDSPKRGLYFKTSTSKSIYGGGVRGSDSWTKRIIADKRIGGSPTLINTRIASSFLRCIEVSKKNNLSERECYLNSPALLSDFNASTIEKTVKISASAASTPMAGVPVGLSGNAARYFPLFVQASKEFGIEDPKMLLAIAMQESGGKLNGNAIGPNKSGSKVLSTDLGVMQINDKAQKNNWKKLYPNSPDMWEGLLTGRSGEAAVLRGIRMGANHFGKTCIKRYGQRSWTAVDCYNKGGGGAATNLRTGYTGFKKWGGGMAYINGVKKHYAKLSGMDLSALSGGSLYSTQAEITQSIATFSTLSGIATERERTLVQVGQDFLEDNVPLHKRAAYIQMVNRWMAQKTLIEASNKKVAELAKTMLETYAFGAAVQSEISKDEANKK